MPFPPAAEGEPDGVELKRVWDLLGRTPRAGVDPRETDEAWRDLSRRLGLPRSGDAAGATGGAGRPVPLHRGGRTRLPMASVLLRAAAVAGVLLAGAAGAWQIPVTERAAPGERRAVTLPDGSRATLNAGSTVRYRRGFAVLPGLPAESRRLSLDGEAFFDVTSAGRPFRVEAGSAAVQVLGTRFNVRARSREARIAVEEGRVEVTDRTGRGSVLLDAGETTRVGPGAAPSRDAIRPERIGAWRTGGLTAVDESLAAILDELSLRYDARVRLVDASLGTDRLSVYYPELGPLESVLSDLATQQDLRYRETADGWELF